MKEIRRTLVEALMTQTPITPATPEAWTPPDTDQPRRRATALWVVVSSLAAVDIAFAAGADRVWLDDPSLDLWSASAPTLPHRDGLWLRHPATAPLSPHLATIGLPIIAGHLGVLAAAKAAKLPVIADVFCNAFSTETLLALQDIGAQAAVISMECSSREVARLAARCGLIEAPQLALIASGRLPAMLTRQDHGLEAGASMTMQAVPKDGGLPYTIERRHHDTVIWEGRRLSCPEQVAQTSGLVDAWILEYGGLTNAQITAGIQRYTGLRDGTMSAADVAEADDEDSQHGTFTGHLHQGSRELDLVADKL